MESIEKLIRNVPDFPKKGIQFKDITPILHDPGAFGKVVDWYIGKIEEHGSADIIAGIESRGFIFGAVIAQKMGKPFTLVRKPGKLPWHTRRVEYELEYGTDALELHTDAIAEGQRIAIVDDLLATGGTAAATAELVHILGGVVGSVTCLIELGFLPGRQKLEAAGVKAIESMIVY